MNWEGMLTPEVLARGWSVLNALSGASLGAAFYVLTKTQPYLANRSYDPKYNAAYIARFIIGVISGVILAIVLKSTTSAGGIAVTPGVLAIVGGYAAEAVELILQRLADILLAVVRGDGAAQSKATAATAVGANNVKMLEHLTDIEAARGDPAKVQKSIDGLRANLKSPRPKP